MPAFERWLRQLIRKKKQAIGFHSAPCELIVDKINFQLSYKYIESAGQALIVQRKRMAEKGREGRGSTGQVEVENCSGGKYGTFEAF